MNKQQQLESVFDALVDLVLRMADKNKDYNPEAIPAIVEQIITLFGRFQKERDRFNGPKQTENESVIKLEGTEMARGISVMMQQYGDCKPHKFPSLPEHEGAQQDET